MKQFEASPGRVLSVTKRYGLSVLLVLCALLVTLLLSPTELFPPLFFLAVMLSAWIGGPGPGLLASLLATSAIDYFFLSPIYSWTFDLAELPHLLVFFLSALLVSSWSAVRKRAETLLRRARDELEAKVQERTADLKQTNEKLQAEITERKRAEEALRRNEAYLVEGQRLTHTGSWAYNPAGPTALYWSQEMFRIFALDPQEGLPSVDKFFERIHPEDRDWLRGRIEKTLHEKVDHVHNHRIVLPDGSIKYIHVMY